MSEQPQWGGRHSYGEISVFRYGGAGDSVLRVGAFSSIAKGVVAVLGGDHDTKRVTTYPFQSLDYWAKEPASPARDEKDALGRGDIEIGCDTWVGMDALLLSGTRIGNGAVVAARSVVNGTVAPYSVVGGNPCRFLRWRFEEQVRVALSEIEWWGWPDERIGRAIPWLVGDPSEFIKKVKAGEL